MPRRWKPAAGADEELLLELELEIALELKLELLEDSELLDLTLLELLEIRELLSDELIAASDDEDGGSSKLVELTSLEDASELETVSTLEDSTEEELIAAALELNSEEDRDAAMDDDTWDDDTGDEDAFFEETEAGAGFLPGPALPPPPPHAVNTRVSDRTDNVLNVYKERLSMIVLLGFVTKTISLAEIAADWHLLITRKPRHLNPFLICCQSKLLFIFGISSGGAFLHRNIIPSSITRNTPPPN